MLLSSVMLVLLAFRAPVRPSGDFVREGLGTLGNVGSWTQLSLQLNLLNKRIHFSTSRNGMLYSGAGRVTAVQVSPLSQRSTKAREIMVTISTMSEKPAGYVPWLREETIPIKSVSGVLMEAHAHVGKSIEVRYADGDREATPLSPVGAFRAGYPNTIIAVYSDGYLEVEVTGVILDDSDMPVGSGTVFIHMEDIARDEHLHIIDNLKTTTHDD